MLGVRRMSAVEIIGVFKHAGLIEHSRGEIRILDMARLEALACECYRVVKEHLDNLTEFDDGLAR